MLPHNEVRALFHRRGLAATHQRQVIYETAAAPPGHSSPEAIYERVRKRIPGISLATVYKNLRIFIDNGLLGQVSLHNGSMRVESNPAPHHHLVCIQCKAIVDLKEEELEPIRFRHKLPHGFRVQRVSVDVLGTCKACAARAAGPRKKLQSH
jgi:Fur family transcriptional regulator, peroxide stress response regulator